MALLICAKSDDEIRYSLPECGAEGFACACRLMGLAEDDYYGVVVEGRLTTLEAIKTLKIENGVAVSRGETVEEAKSRALAEVKSKYLQVCGGKDPVTGKAIYVDCLAGGTAYRMNAGRVAAETLKSGVDLAESNGLTEYFLVDFYDGKYEPVAMADIKEVNRIQGNDSAIHYLRKGELKELINAATTVEEVQAIEISFTVNTE